MRMGKHARAPTPGPITLTFNAVTTAQPKPVRIILYAWPLILPLTLIPAAIHGELLSYADAVLGYDATLCLIACLVVTPAITVAKLKITKLRWWYGLLVFFIGFTGLAIHLAYPPGDMQTRVAGTVTDWTGILIIALLTPMALTSCVAAQKLLGPEWKRWQRDLMWCVWFVIIVHLLTTHAWLVVVAYSAATVTTFIPRIPQARKSIKTWRAGGYSTGGWWVIFTLLTLMFIIGVMIIVGEEGATVARAITGT
jgi:DMSO/TMAO reductase YedYZ heme-binding membrane subunit